jgi:hypothetical protein
MATDNGNQSNMDCAIEVSASSSVSQQPPTPCLTAVELTNPQDLGRDSGYDSFDEAGPSIFLNKIDVLKTQANLFVCWERASRLLGAALVRRLPAPSRAPRRLADRRAPAKFPAPQSLCVSPLGTREIPPGSVARPSGDSPLEG